MRCIAIALSALRLNNWTVVVPAAADFCAPVPNMLRRDRMQQVRAPALIPPNVHLKTSLTLTKTRSGQKHDEN